MPEMSTKFYCPNCGWYGPYGDMNGMGCADCGREIPRWSTSPPEDETVKCPFKVGDKVRLKHRRDVLYDEIPQGSCDNKYYWMDGETVHTIEKIEPADKNKWPCRYFIFLEGVVGTTDHSTRIKQWTWGEHLLIPAENNVTHKVIDVLLHGNMVEVSPSEWNTGNTPDVWST